ncbi:hypothetical protein [Kitasatospora sp. NPDC056181]|uniref:hypothetical protein n=1 Tax=Kitasatospora sp. NPDC056181 TaxID=3345737 RepID=UPI0035D74196
MASRLVTSCPTPARAGPEGSFPAAGPLVYEDARSTGAPSRVASRRVTVTGGPATPRPGMHSSPLRRDLGLVEYAVDEGQDPPRIYVSRVLRVD